MSHSRYTKHVSKSNRTWRNRTTIAPRCTHRHIVLGATYLVTKKCDRDEMLIRPSPVICAILLYLLILKAWRYRIVIHGFVFMSNHFHLVVTDPEGNLPKFCREFLGESSKAIQASQKGEGLERAEGKIWSSDRVLYTRLLDADAAQRKLIYTLLNPAKARLTRPEDWPGLTSARTRFGAMITARRPDVYFSEKRPEEVSIQLTPLSEVFRGLGEAEALADFEAEYERELASLEAEMDSKGQSYVGATAVLAQRRDAVGTTRVARIRPRFATRDRSRLKAAIDEYDEFERRHEAARRRYLGGERNVEFPAGTYGFRVMYGVRCADDRQAA